MAIPSIENDDLKAPIKSEYDESPVYKSDLPNVNKIVKKGFHAALWSYTITPMILTTDMILSTARLGDVWAPIAGLILIPIWIYLGFFTYSNMAFDHKLTLFKDHIRIEYRVPKKGVVCEMYPLRDLIIEKPERKKRPYQLTNSKDGNTYSISIEEMNPLMSYLQSLRPAHQWSDVL